jgi:mycobactin salicyl-AMP ligase
MLLAAKASRRGQDVAFVDPPGRRQWSGLAGGDVTFAEAEARTKRLAGVLAALGLAPDTAVGILLPNGSEACLSLLACQRAGLRPCLMSLAWNRDQLMAALLGAGVQAVITQARVGALRPAELMCSLAASFFGLRFLCAFGDDVPDGIFALDALMAEDTGAEAIRHVAGGFSFITFEPSSGLSRPVAHEADALISAALPIVVGARIADGSTIINLMAQDDLVGLAGGLALLLATGARLDLHGLFDGQALIDEVEAARQAHLVAPGWLEPMLREAGIVESGHLASLVLIHHLPFKSGPFKPLQPKPLQPKPLQPKPLQSKPLPPGHAAEGQPPPRSPMQTVDVVALGELALLVAPRDADGSPAVGLDLPVPMNSEPVRLTEARLSAAGFIEVRGRATIVRDDIGVLSKGLTGKPDAAGWRTTRFKAELAGRRVVAIHASEDEA